MLTKVLEAMAVGTPVVGTTKALEGIPDDLHQFLTHADSAEEFAGQVERILRDPEPALKRAADGLAAIADRHTWRQSVEQLEALYDEAIAAARPADRP
jgi:glycosyltransferase involved in cell wall biosynthesis